MSCNIKDSKGLPPEEIAAIIQFIEKNIAVSF